MRAVRHLAAATALAVAGLACPRTDTAPTAPVAPDDDTGRLFYAALADHGTWLDDAAHGWVWLPATSVVGAEFFPYLSAGRWLYTDAGWMFASDHAWGWAPFHYGRWAFDPGVGWMWIPGAEWGPAWVDWRWSAGHVGWAPLPPALPNGAPASREDLRSHWVVVAAGDLTRERLPDHILPISQAQVVFAAEATHPEAGPGWRVGPPAELIAAATGRPLTPVHLPRPDHVGLVRSRVEGEAVRHTPFVAPTQPPAASTFPRSPPALPAHTMLPHTIEAPVFPARRPTGEPAPDLGVRRPAEIPGLPSPP